MTMGCLYITNKKNKPKKKANGYKITNRRY